MDSLAPIFLAAANAPDLDVIIWIVAGAIWVFAQIAAAKKKKERKERQAQQSPPPAGPSSSAGDAPTPDDLAEIFKRLGADIPSTPPPRPAAAQSTAPPPPPRRRMPVDYTKLRKIEPTPVRPEIAQRLARAKREATEAARKAKALAVPPPLNVPKAVRSIEVTCAQHTGAILPRFYAMGMQLAPLPSLPMPGVNRTNHTGTPFPVHLHSRLDLRNAIVAQIFLSPAKASEL